MIELLVVAPCGAALQQQLTQRFADRYHIVFADRKTPGFEDYLANAEVILGQPHPKALANALKLRWLQMTWAGVDRYTLREGFPADRAVLTNASGAYGPIISEYVMAGILSHYRNLPAYGRNQKSGLWQDLGREECLEGKTALILGTGDIGTNVAKRLQVFGTQTLGIRRRVAQQQYFDRVCPMEELDELLPKADLVIGCLPNTPSTRGLLDKNRLLGMKAEALLVNVGRGSLIVTEHLVEVLQSGHLRGAVLDVVDPEPLPPEHPLWQMENVILTPHISGIAYGHNPATEQRVWQLCFENLERYAANRPLQHVVDLTAGY